MDDVAAWARAYHGLGWSVIPCLARSKRAAVRWKRFQNERATDNHFREWFNQDANLSIITGTISGGLVVRDFDAPGSYDHWRASNPTLARELPTVRSSRGYHVYGRTDQEVGVVHLGDGELRGEGGYTLAPPSFHPDGSSYQWIQYPSDPLPLVDLADFGVGDLKQRGQSRQSQPSQQSQPKTEDDYKSHEGDVNAVDDAIAATVPSGTGQRERKLFELARRLHAILGPDLTTKELVPIFDRWWLKAEPIVGTKDYADSLAALDRAYERVHTEWGKTLNEVLITAKSAEAPEWSRRLRCELLACICRELQHINGTEPFFLSARTAAHMTGDSPTGAWRKLGLLEKLGYLTVVERGIPGGKRATRYRYVAPE